MFNVDLTHNLTRDSLTHLSQNKTSFLYTTSHSTITQKMNLSLQLMDWRFLTFFYGVIYLQNNTVFVILQHGERVEFLCRCSFLEIYNEQIFDLLDPASIGLSLREDLKKGVFVDGLLERDVASARDAYRVGCKNQRKCSENKGNVKIISCSRNTFLWFSIIIIFGLLNIQIAVIIMWWYFIS